MLLCRRTPLVASSRDHATAPLSREASRLSGARPLLVRTALVRAAMSLAAAGEIVTAAGARAGVAGATAAVFGAAAVAAGVGRTTGGL